MVGDVAFVSASVEKGEGALSQFAASIDSEKLPSNPCLPTVVAEVHLPDFEFQYITPFYSEYMASFSLSSSLPLKHTWQWLGGKTSNRMQGYAFASWEHVTSRGKQSEGQEPNCSGHRGCIHCL